MKQLLSIIAITSSLFFISCKKDIASLNTNPINPETVSSQSLFANATLNLSNVMASTNVNNNNFRLWNQYWTETIYRDETRYNINGRSISDRWWATFYRDIIKDLDEASKTASTETVQHSAAEIKNRKALNEILTVYSYYTLITTFGDVPYTEALDINNTQPKYDVAAFIFDKIRVRLDAAIANIDTQSEGYGSNDLLLGGDMDMWKMFAYSLKMRMGMLVADVSPSVAQAMVSDAADKVISSNDENISFSYLAAPPNTNPVWEDLIQSGRHDFIATKPFIDTLNGLSDPRLPILFTKNSGGIYKGQTPGRSASFSAYSGPSEVISDPMAKHTFFSYAEMEFLKAEAVERGFLNDNTAQQHYNNAVEASLLEWGCSASAVSAYLANPKVNYSTPVPGGYKQKIGIQSWIAFCNRGYDGFTQLRRLDYPKLSIPYGVPNIVNPYKDGETPGVIVRMTYPVLEQNVNKANYDKAVSSIGNDWITQKLWFDVN